MLQQMFAIRFVAFATVALTTAVIQAQQFVAPQPQTGQLPYGGRPLLQVAPDGAVHLDGPYAQYSNPAVVAQPGAVVGQPVPAPQASSFSQGVSQQLNLFTNWLYNDPVPPQFKHRHGFFGDFLYLRPRNAEVAYALPIDGPVAPVLGNEVPIGPTAVVDFDYEPAFRVGAVLRLHDGASIVGQYSYFRSDDASAATINPADGVLRSLVSHPLGANTATDSLDANASLALDYDLVDVDYRGMIVGCESCQGKCAYIVNYLIGGRYAHAEQDFRSNFTVINTTSVDTNVDYDGGGIRLGLEGERHSTATGFYVYGRGVTNLMVGEFKADYRQTHSLNGVEAFTDWSAGRVVPVIDLELGLGWVGPRRRLKFSGGYLVSSWFNVVKTEDFINAVQSHNFDDMSGNLTFDGLVARATWEF